ncbi:PA domain-containing protein [Geodermatophilus africanus]|uniref:PA domain-containing protein n=1 Tax=Geodermatophilus africanus TaxID=1137993 RepID=A0A1H3FYM2_9ACTN|nr:M28 family metallopeptidase [Geodermatophilus africanus]SDX95935.1 PA domain-containing protein [Geodermatophilus africanus]
MTRTTSHRVRAVALGAAGAMALAGTVALAGPAAAAPGGSKACEKKQVNDTVAELTECVTLNGVMEHLEAFQAIADAPENAGTRASGTPGFTASADYVEKRLRRAGWEVSRQQFDFPFFQLRSSSFSRVAPTATTYQVGTDYVPMTYTASGTVDDRAVTPVDIDSTTSGCETEDFTGFAAGTVALVQRGTCPFGLKAGNAAAAGASAVVVFNNAEGPLNGTLGAPGVTIPVVGVPTTLGRDLATAGTTIDLAVDSTSEIRQTENVVAELPGSTSDNVVMAGAHLDSVPEGPGINDNGSGSAALIEVAENMAKVDLPNTVRFAWWGAEELGLLGSNHYVASLTPEQREDIGLYLNFDMVGSPNFARLIYDGDLSAFPAPPGVPVPEGSDQIEYVFEDFYEEQQLFYEGTEFSGRSDYQAFILAGIPSGGLFTGAEDIKQPYQAEAYGGEAGVAYDPNYHQVGDDITNLDPEALDQNSDAIAYAVLTLGYDSQRVNGVVGKPVPGGTFEGDPAAREYRLSAAQPNGGGGLHAGHDHEHGEQV